MIQSSSATTVMVVGFVNAGIMNLNQAMGVIMGANIGIHRDRMVGFQCGVGKILSPANLAPLAIIIGVVIMLTGTRRSTKRYFQYHHRIWSVVRGNYDHVICGISITAVGRIPNIFVVLGGNPFLGIVAGALVTAIIQSSSASVGILQSLAAAGLVPFNAAIYIIMGQNIGTCVTAMLSSVGAKRNAKTAAIMHLLFNIIGTIIFSIVAIVFFQAIRPDMGAGIISQTQIMLATYDI